MILKKIEAKKIVDIIVRSIFRLGNLLQDHRSFALDLFPFEFRMKKDVGQQIDSERQVFVEDLGVIASMLFGREGIEDPSHRIHLLRNLRGRTPVRSFEKEMLYEVGDAILVMCLVTGTVFHPNSETHRTMIRHLL